ncbi:MAG: dTMP kinase [Bacteroidales bacterium]|jgi:dTMP kinase|nr:dTMP kinase [Bacteroidales bacterium]
MGLIVIEGLDGSGKSTQINKLYEYLSSRGHKCHLLHFPRTDSPVYGELIARFLRGDLGEIHQVDPYLVALIYAGDRFDFKPELEKWLQEDAFVLLDRYVYSNIAYQCAKIENEKEKKILRDWILHLEFEYHGLPKPDLNIFLDVPFGFTHQKLTNARSGDERTYLNGKRDIHEADLDFQEKVRNAYLLLSDEDAFLKISCNDNNSMLPVEQVFDKVLAGLNEKKINV